MAREMGVPPLLVGLTVVAFGTSAPELAVGLRASLAGNPGLALGNVFGSNVFNLLLILGLTALIRPLPIQRQLIRLDVPVMVGASLLVFFLAVDGVVGLFDGCLLLALGIGYVAYLTVLGRGRADEIPQLDASSEKRLGESSGEPGPGTLQHGPGSGVQGEATPDARVTARRRVLPRVVDGGRIILGLVGLVMGSSLLVEGSASFARGLGVSELVIGLTLVAGGTSLPELVTSVLAGLRGERDLAVGNVVGSNIFNLFFVLGGAGVAAPHGLSIPLGALTFDLPVMVAVALACVPIFVTGRRIHRLEGGAFVVYYLVYTAFLVLDASGHASRDLFIDSIAAFLLPLTVLTAIMGWWPRKDVPDDP